jgi:hypothetical protein
LQAGQAIRSRKRLVCRLVQANSLQASRLRLRAKQQFAGFPLAFAVS